MAAGNDGKVMFYDIDGGVERTFDYGIDKRCKVRNTWILFLLWCLYAHHNHLTHFTLCALVQEFTVAAFNSMGSIVVIGNYNCFYVYCHDKQTNTWAEKGVKHVENMFSVTALSWKTDGSQLAVGGFCGVLDIYDACTSRECYKDTFEFIYANNGQVIVKQLGKREEIRIVLKSRFGYAITKIDIFQER